MPNITDTGVLRVLSQGDLRKRQREALVWFRDKLGLSRGTQNIFAEDIIQRQKNVSVPYVGQLLLFQYDAKHKDTLPYWDMYPLAMIIDIQDNGFLSLNLHYLDYNYRYLLIKRLLATVEDDRFDHRTKAKINYIKVRDFSQFQFAQPCIKKHLYSQIRSKIVRIQPTEWDHAVYLPMDMFVGASKQRVWADSRKMISRMR